MNNATPAIIFDHSRYKLNVWSKTACFLSCHQVKVTTSCDVYRHLKSRLLLM
ncbi:hypothetical protein QPK13_23265 [Photorhabdus tasmaniensis]